MGLPAIKALHLLAALDNIETIAIKQQFSSLFTGLGTWCAGMMVVNEKNGGVRICVDLKPLNHCVLREHHLLPKVDEVLAQLTGATTFTKLDANSGFWQVPLSENSRLLTTFITPFGRYCYNKLPFGISSAPEHFQRRMHLLLEGVLCVIDDIFIFGQTK